MSHQHRTLFRTGFVRRGNPRFNGRVGGVRCTTVYRTSACHGDGRTRQASLEYLPSTLVGGEQWVIASTTMKDFGTVDAYAQYARWRRARPLGLENRRLAAMLGDFVYETSSAEDESRRILELLHAVGRQTLSAKDDVKALELFTSEHNREQRRADGIEEKHVSWGRIDRLSQQIIRVLSQTRARTDPDFVENLDALNRMFATTEALRGFRNRVDHRAPSDGGGRLQFYRDSDSPVSPRIIWGWTEVAASYWSNLTRIGNAISMATGIDTFTSRVSNDSAPLQWPPPGISIHGLRVIQDSGIPVPQQQMSNAQADWLGLTHRWKRKSL